MGEKEFFEWQKNYAGAGIESFEIYQLKDEDRLLPYLFESFSYACKCGHSIKVDDYNPVYVASISEFCSEEDKNESNMLNVIYEAFNIDRTADFQGHSLSVSDVIIIKECGKEAKAYYVDNFGFSEVPEFLDAANTSGKRDMEMR